MNEKVTRVSLAQVRKLKSLSNAKRFNEFTDSEIDKMIESDPDLYQLTDDELAQFDLARNNRNEDNRK